MNEKLKNIIENLDTIRLLNERDVVVTVIDREGVIQGYSISENVEPLVKVGDVFVDPTGAFLEVMKTGKPKHNILPADVMGMAMEGDLVPIMDEREIVGCIISTYSVADKERTHEIATQFQKSVGEVNDLLQQIISGMESLFKMLAEMDHMTADVEKDVNGASDVVNKVSNNASRSNILALNASIEAARSGEAGRGFAVVATEMGKLANESGSSASAIKSTLDVIAEHLQSIIGSIKDANSVAKEHMEGIHAIKETLEQTLTLASQLEQ